MAKLVAFWQRLLLSQRGGNGWLAILLGMSDDGVQQRLSRVEDQVRRLTARLDASERDAAAARVLAGAADRDVSQISSELRDFRAATTASFNAQREDFNDLREDLNTRFEKVDAGFIEMRGKFDAMAAGQQQIVGLLTGRIDDGAAGG